MNKGRYHSTVKSRRKTIGGNTKITYRPTMTSEVVDASSILLKILGPIAISLGALAADLFKTTKKDTEVKDDKARIAELEAEIERLKKQSH